MDDDGIRLNKAQILERLQAEHFKLFNVLAQLMPEERAQPQTLGAWSVRDMMAHTIYWNRFPIREMECACRGDNPEQVRDPRHEDEINAENVARYTDAGYDQVMLEFERSYRELVAAVEALPEHAFEADGAIERLLGDTISQTLNSNTYDHWALHRAQIEARFNLQ